jgi:hypothetical protein
MVNPTAITGKDASRLKLLPTGDGLDCPRLNRVSGCVWCWRVRHFRAHGGHSQYSSECFHTSSATAGSPYPPGRFRIANSGILPKYSPPRYGPPSKTVTIICLPQTAHRRLIRTPVSFLRLLKSRHLRFCRSSSLAPANSCPNCFMPPGLRSCILPCDWQVP